MAKTLAIVLLGVDKLSPVLKKSADNADRLGDSLQRVSKAPAIAGGLMAGAGAATALGAALAPAAAALGALPALQASVKAGALTARVGLMGMGEAMSAVAEGDAKALEESLQKLSPEARKFVKETAGMRGELDGVRKSVQDRMFDGLADQIKPVAGNLLPTAKRGMEGVASAMNGAAKEAAAFGQTPLAKGVLAQVFGTTEKVIRSATGTVQPFLGAVARLVQLGTPLAQRMAQWAINGVKAGAAFVNSERGATFLANALERAEDRLGQLGRIAKNVTTAVTGMFSQGNATGLNLLGTIESLTAKWSAWANSAQGQAQVAQTLTLLGDAARALASALPLLLGPLGAIVSLIGSLPAPMQSAAAQGLALAVVVGTLGGKLMTVGRVGVTAALGVTQFVGGLAGGPAALAANASGAARAGAALRSFSAAALLAKAQTVATTAAQWVAATASKAWAGAIWLVNAAMRANPLGIVITVIMALVGAVVLAYQKSETFRNIVQTAWRGIQTAVAYAWNNVIKPAFFALHGFVTGTLAPAAMWFWNSIIKPAWKGISFAIDVAWGIIKIIFAAFKFYLEKVVAPVVSWLWRNIIQPAWKGISFAIDVAWGIIKIIFAAFKFYLEKVVAPVVTWLWKNIISPAWNAIKSVISVVWNSGIKPVFENVKKGVELVGKAFESAKNFIGRVWDKVRDLAMKPIRFVVETVYTKGIKGVWDRVAKFVGADPLPAAPAFAAGGPVRQGTTSKADDVLAKLSRGEFVVNSAAVRRNAGLIDYVNRRGKNKDVLKEMSLAGDPGGVLPGFAEGGIVGWIKSWASKAKNFFEDGLAKALDGVIGPINGLIDRTLGTSGLGGLIGGVPKKALAGIRGWLMDRKDKLEGGGPGAQGAVRAARRQIGVPYSWGGGGLHGPTRGIQQGANITGFDCSSLMRYAWYQSTKKVMPRTTYTQWPWLDKVSTPRPGDLGFPHMGHVFMNSGNGKIIEAPYTGARVREVPMRGARWGRPPASFSRADSGTAVLEPGMNGVYNGTGAREPLVRPDLVNGVTIKELHVHVPLGADEVQTGRAVLKAIQAAVKRDGKAGVKAIMP
jgi:NlpC/P60 family